MQNINGLEYRYLKQSDDLLEIGRLLYHADPYIYPAFLGNEDNASILIAEAIKRKLYCFCEENIFCALENNKPVAILCKKQVGKYKWNYNEWKSLFVEKNIKIPDSFEHVARNHFMRTNEAEINHQIYIFAVCVSYRLRNNGIGSKMLRSFMSLHTSEEYVLDVLESNIAAISLYKGMGFVPEGHYTGYNIQDPRPQCIHMIKKSK